MQYWPSSKGSDRKENILWLLHCKWIERICREIDYRGKWITSLLAEYGLSFNFILEYKINKLLYTDWPPLWQQTSRFWTKSIVIIQTRLIVMWWETELIIHSTDRRLARLQRHHRLYITSEICLTVSYSNNDTFDWWIFLGWSFSLGSQFFGWF